MLVEGKKERKVEATVADIARQLRGIDGLQALGPAPAVITRIKDRYRMHCLAKCASDDAFRVAMERLASIESRGTSALRVILDVDPGSLL